MQVCKNKIFNFVLIQSASFQTIYYYYYYYFFGVNAAPCVDVDDNIDNLGPTLPVASSVPVLVLVLPALDFF